MNFKRREPDSTPSEGMWLHQVKVIPVQHERTTDLWKCTVLSSVHLSIYFFISTYFMFYFSPMKLFFLSVDNFKTFLSFRMNYAAFVTNTLRL